MKEKYAEWIKQNVTDTYGKCAEVTAAMADAFPFELNRVRGHYWCSSWGERAHWWLIDLDDDSIVDPTAAQFPSRGNGEYVEWDDSQEEPTGKCPNCGEACYKGNYCCSEECGQQYAAYCTNAWKTAAGRGW